MTETGTARAGSPYETTGDGVSDKASAVKDQAREQAQNAAGQARDRVREQVGRRSTQAGEQVKGQADDLRTVGRQLREQGQDGPAKIADQVADRAERVGSWLHDSDADRILGDVEDYARRNPWTVVAGGLALGLVASRALKASSGRRYEQRSAGPGELPAAANGPTPPASGRADEVRFEPGVALPAEHRP